MLRKRWCPKIGDPWRSTNRPQNEDHQRSDRSPRRPNRRSTQSPGVPIEDGFWSSMFMMGKKRWAMVYLDGLLVYWWAMVYRWAMVYCSGQKSTIFWGHTSTAPLKYPSAPSHKRLRSWGLLNPKGIYYQSYRIIYIRKILVHISNESLKRSP